MLETFSRETTLFYYVILAIGFLQNWTLRFTVMHLLFYHFSENMYLHDDSSCISHPDKTVDKKEISANENAILKCC